jgi:hypothetical protein
MDRHRNGMRRHHPDWMRAYALPRGSTRRWGLRPIGRPLRAPYFVRIGPGVRDGCPPSGAGRSARQRACAGHARTFGLETRASNNDMTAPDRLNMLAGRDEQAEDHVEGVRGPPRAGLARDVEPAGDSDVRVTNVRPGGAAARWRQPRSDVRAPGPSVQQPGSDQNAVAVHRLASDTRGELFLNCPRCGLTITPRAAWLVVRHCPRCLARSHTAVELFSSRLPAKALYASGSAPRAEGLGAEGRSRRR